MEPDAEEAWAAALYLNNKYEIDGRDPTVSPAWPGASASMTGRGGRGRSSGVRFMNDRV
jgi:hypothetical protein